MPPSVLGELIAVATKVAADGAIKGKGMIKDAISGLAAAGAGSAAEELAKKVGLLRTNKFGELVLKVPFFKTVEERIEETFALHPEREKMCFHFGNSIRDGVDFYDPEGNKTYVIHESKKNLRRIELYKGDRFAGSIEKHVTINWNPFANKIQKYDSLVHNYMGTMIVDTLDSKVEYESWSLKHKKGAHLVIENKAGEELGRFYSLGSGTFVMDYLPDQNPVGFILAYMALIIRKAEVSENHYTGHKGSPLWIEDVIANLKDTF